MNIIPNIIAANNLNSSIRRHRNISSNTISSLPKDNIFYSNEVSLNQENEKENIETVNKIYCKNCKFHFTNFWGTYYCKYKQYIEISSTGEKYYTECEKLNSDYNCQKYKRKWWKFWIH